MHQLLGSLSQVQSHTEPGVRAKRSVLVAACGNAQAGDDAFGPSVAAALRHHPNGHLRIVNLAMVPASLSDHLPGACGLVIVDAVLGCGGEAGLIDMEWDSQARPRLMSDRAISTHGLSVADQVELARALGALPPVVRLIGVEARATKLGEPMSRAVRRLVPVTARRVRALGREIAGEPSPTTEQSPRIVVIGYGNPLRADDAVGYLAAQELAAKIDDPRVLVVSSHGLLPEMAESLSKAELAVFIDASVQNAPGVVKCRPVEPLVRVRLSQMHHLDPPVLLACARRLFKRCPGALVLSIGVGSLDHREGLSPPVRRALARVVSRVRALVTRDLRPLQCAGAEANHA
jgi:hydrogenase maturation protease